MSLNLLLFGKAPKKLTAAFNPATDLIAGSLWLDASILADADGTALASWPDALAAAYTFAQATGANQPLVKTNIQNGKRGVLFDGTNDNMSAGDVLDMGAAQDFSIMACFQAATAGAGAGRHLLSKKANTTTSAGWRIAQNSGNTWLMHVADGTNSITSTSTTAVADSVTRIATSTFDRDGNGVLYINGTQEDSDAISTVGNVDNAVNLALGALNGGASSFWMGYLFELILEKKVWSDAERTARRNYLVAKWAVV